MKRIILSTLFIGTVMASSPDNVDRGKYDFDKIEEAYCISLRYDNIGVVESSLYCVVKMCHQFPNKNFKRIKNVVDDLSTNSGIPLIRYKANVAILYLNNQTLMQQLTLQDFENGPDFWAKLVKYVQSLPHDQILG